MLELFKKAYEGPSEELLPSTRGKIIVDADSCWFCTRCERACSTNAIVVDPSFRQIYLVQSECTKCGRCVKKCPRHALAFER